MSLYEQLGGEAVTLRLARTWHELCLADELASHPFTHSDLHPAHDERVAAYWSEALGGPSRYSETMGDQSHVVRMHSGNGVHEELDRRCEQLFAQALIDAHVPVELHQRLTDWFVRMNMLMAAHPHGAEEVPDGLVLPVEQ